MNDELNTALAELIYKATAGVEDAVGFLSAELPDVINQLLTWKLIESLLGFGLGVLFLIVPYLVYRLIRKLCGYDELPEYMQDNINIPALVFIPVLFIVGVIVASCNLTWLQILIAPKLFLIEYASTLIK